MVKVKVPLEEKLGEEKIQEILEKEWKTAELPPEEVLAQEKHESSKARNNPNSRKNLIQYRKDKPLEVKKKILEPLVTTEVQEDIDPKTIVDPRVDVDFLNNLMPAHKLLKDAGEQKQYWSMINLLLRDFDVDELTASDMHDIIQLALNSVLESRVLEAAKAPKMVLESAGMIEKYRKQSDKLKEGLASRRRDRVDPKNKTSFSIVDLAVAYDDDRRRAYEERVRKVLEDEANYPHQTSYKKRDDA